jgi:hypothetical protein
VTDSLTDHGWKQPMSRVHNQGVNRRRWSDLTDRQKTALLVAASVQLSLAATAWVDLARRPSDQVNGPKGAWAAAIAVNFVGPISYFAFGVRRCGLRPTHPSAGSL